jgi:Ser/Thr protein kinase RdoA (MazF antagonist)
VAIIDSTTLRTVILSFLTEGKEALTIEAFGSGLIHYTWKVSNPDTGKAYILQRINDAVFHHPWNIAFNIKSIQEFLEQHYPDYLFIGPVKTKAGHDLFYDAALGYFRLFPFVRGSHSIDIVSEPGQAYEAARQFALFTKLLSGYNVQSLKITLKDFHNMGLRYHQFEDALTNGNKERLDISKEFIAYLKGHRDIADVYEKIKNNPAFRLRVTHHDTKISNVLFDQENKGLCVIDLDTVMPGYFISDIGDMMRTYLSPANEEEADHSKICIREDFFDAIVSGYVSEMNNELTSEEKSHFVYAGKFMIYMQALRFLTDYLNNDRYYGAKYEQHNLDRAKNQIVLLQRLFEKENVLNHIAEDQLAIVIPHIQ